MGTAVGGQSMWGDVTEALKWYHAAVAIQPTSLKAYANLGSALSATNKTKAIQLLQETPHEQSDI